MVKSSSDQRNRTNGINKPFWRVLGIVLVLSEAVLVIVIDVSIIRCAGLSDAIEFLRHPSQHCDDPMQHRFHRSIILDMKPLIAPVTM